MKVAFVIARNKVTFVIARNEVTKQSIAETAWRWVASAYGLAITEGQEG